MESARRPNVPKQPSLVEPAGAGQHVGVQSSDALRKSPEEPPVSPAGELARALLQGMLDPVLAIDEHGIIRVASRSVQGAFGYAPEELVGRNVKLLMPEPQRSAHDGHLARYRAGGQATILGRTLELQVQHRDGFLIDVELSVAQVDAPGSQRLFIGSFRNVTRRREAERAERSMLRALATIGESAALLAHEIKHPVTAVNLALRAVAQKLGEDERQVVGDLAARMRRLELQLRQTLSFARPLDLACAPCRPDALLARVAQAMGPVLESAGVSLERHVADAAPPVPVDHARLEEVITNLLMNAVEMLGPGGRVRVVVTRDGPGHVLFELEDDGPGVPAALSSSLFQPFVTSKAEGTGLGLPICRRIVEAHGGSIDVRVGPLPDGALGGACFRVRLPLQRPAGGASP